MNSTKSGNDARGGVFAQRMLMAGAYLAAASLVSWSAWSAKRSSGVPALAAVETIRVSTAPAPDTNRREIAEPMNTVVGIAEQHEGSGSEFTTVEVTEPISNEIRYFNGRAVRPAKTLWMTVTGYSPDERSCGAWADGITASNKSVWTNAMQLVAADTRVLPFGSLLTIEGYAGDQIVPVEDRGGAIKGMRLDLLYPTHEEALQWGVKRLPVTVWEYVED
ncbi:MAG: 3D domain-containing protein [Phycisphaerales bacterium JB065]